MVVVSGGSIGAGARALLEDRDITIIGLDIYHNGNTDLVADVSYSAGDRGNPWRRIQAMLDTHALHGKSIACWRSAAGLCRDAVHAAGARGRLRFLALYRERPSLAVSRLRSVAHRRCFFGLRYLDLADGRYATDSASGVFFLGRKSCRAIDHDDIIAYYDSLDRPADAHVSPRSRPRVLSPQR